MRILLVVPPLDDPYAFLTPNLGLGYIGAALVAEGHQVELLDLAFYADPFAQLDACVDAFKPQIVGITGFTPHYLNVRRIARQLKARRPDLVTVFGGPHASALGPSILSAEAPIDFVLQGEGERAFPALVRLVQEGGDPAAVPGLVFRRNGGTVANENPLIEDLDGLASPWTVIDPLRYQQGRVHGFIVRRMPVAQVLSSRGCPYLCTFCAGKLVHGRRIRLRSPARFVDELAYLKQRYGIREVQIVDDNFTFNRDHAAEICETMIGRKLDLLWSLPNGVRADRLDESLLRLMKRAGCYYLAFGIEFGSPRMLKIVKKALNLEQARESVRLANRLGFITQGFFLLGHPEETPEDMASTRRFVRSTPFDKVLLIPPFPYPGTELFDYYLERKGMALADIDWDTFRAANFDRIYEHTTADAVHRQRLIIFREFYLNPVNALRFLGKFRTWTQVRSAAQGLAVFLNVLARRQ